MFHHGVWDLKYHSKLFFLSISYWISFIYLFVFLCVYQCFASMNVWTPYMCLMPTEDRRQDYIPWDRSYSRLWATMCVPGIEPVSSGRSAHALNCRAVSSDLKHILKNCHNPIFLWVLGGPVGLPPLFPLLCLGRNVSYGHSYSIFLGCVLLGGSYV